MSGDTKKCALQLYTELGSSPVWLTKIEGSEGLSQLFHYRLQVATKEPLSLDKVMGKPVSFGIAKTDDQPGRDFNGIIISLAASCDSSLMGWYRYEIEVVPWLWFMTQRTNCRIFPGQGQRQMVTITKVLQALCDDYSSFALDLSGIKGSYPQRDFWMQYNETDFNFFSRLTEEHGIFYYFQQTRDQHRLIVADQKQAYDKTTAEPYLFGVPGSTQPQVHYWKHHYQFVAKKCTVSAHNFQQPTIKLKTTSDSRITMQRPGNCEHYVYTNNYLERDQGESLAKLCSEREEAQYSLAEGQSNILSLSVGSYIQLKAKDFPQETEHKFVITQLKFTATDASLPDDSAHQSPTYSNTFQCIPAGQVYRPPCLAIKPQSYQLHEAVVTGPQNEEIHTDELGQLRIQFRWDHEGNDDANSSCWVRASSDWEGVLRVGTPVLVGFLQGNIDQPIVLGPLYDTQQKPLFPESTMSGLKRRHGINGDYSYYNELRFNDKKDEAHVLLHACKDMAVMVDNDLTTEIKHHEQHTVEEQRQTQIKKGDDTLVLDQGNLIIHVKEGHYELQVKGNITIQSNGNIELKADQALKLSAGQSVDIQAGTSLNQKATTVAIKGDTSVDLDATSTTIKGSATVGVKGGMINLN